jgi:predicted nucleic acid-binding protein
MEQKGTRPRSRWYPARSCAASPPSLVWNGKITSKARLHIALMTARPRPATQSICFGANLEPCLSIFPSRMHPTRWCGAFVNGQSGIIALSRASSWPSSKQQFRMTVRQRLQKYWLRYAGWGCTLQASPPASSVLIEMAVKVVDASAIAALLFGEPDAENISERLADARLVAPALLGFELANVCLLKCRRHPDQQKALKTAFRLRDRFGIDEVAVDHSAALDLAAETGLTAYDASYLWVARQLQAELITLDRQLATAEATFHP